MDKRNLDIRDLLAARTQYRTATGLYVVLHQDLREPATAEARGWATNPLGLAIPVQPAPSMLEQLVVVVDEEALDLEPSTVADVRALVKPLPYAPALVWVARILRRLWPIRNAPDRQLELARELFVEAPVVERFERFLAAAEGGERRYLFSEQQLHTLSRLVLESADGDLAETWNEEHNQRIRQALIAVTSVVGEGAAKVRAEGRALEDWLGFFAQNGNYNANSQPLLSFQRMWRIYVELPETNAARGHPQHCPFDEWTRQRYGTGLKELYAVGFAAGATAQKADAPPDSESIVQPFERYLANTAVAGEQATFTEALTAPREFYVEGFARSHDDALRLAWEVTPFQQRPFMRLPGDQLLLISPRAMQSWLTEGAHYRLLDIAIRRSARDDFTTFVGWLFETYACELFETALGNRSAGDGRVHREQDYAGQKTSDVAVDFGRDLVLCEVVSTRLPLGVRAEADEDELATYLQRTITDKLEQLDRVVTDLLDERAHIPGVTITNVERVWPVLTTVGEVVEGEPLCALIRRECGHLLQQAVCQPLSLVGIDDVEVALGAVAAGDELVALLRQKNAGPYRELSWARWLTDTRETPPPRLPALEARWEEMMNEAVRVLGLPPEGNGTW
jgi:hypothetical protein